MRETKFRAKSPKGEWVIGSLTPSGGGISLALFFSDIAYGRLDIKTLGEYTGLKDSKSREQYEGDIKDFGMYSNEIYGRCLHVIYWNEKDACFNTRELGFQKQEGFPVGGEEYEGYITGNIYENPELLEQENISRGVERP